MSVGNTTGIGPGNIPARWQGPTWLILNACSAMQPNVGREGIFGGHLHGVLGFHVPGYGLQTSGYQTLIGLIGGYNTAINDWEQATAADGMQTSLAMLVPAMNTADAMENRGGPQFGYDGSTSPVYYTCCDARGNTFSNSVARVSTSSVYALNGEQMNESYWESYYGALNTPSKITTPTANEHDYRNPYVMLKHYLASGGLVVTSGPTGHAYGFSAAQALSYAQSWLQSNGGLPPDAVLTAGGAETVTPAQGASGVAGAPYSNVRRYAFTWRHSSSGVLLNDHVVVAVDDEGSLTPYTHVVEIYNVHCQCLIPTKITSYVAPWIPAYHVTTYARVWRTLGPATSTVKRQSSLVKPQGTLAGSSLCASDMSSPVSQASPCDIYTVVPAGTATPVNTYVDTVHGSSLGLTEHI